MTANLGSFAYCKDVPVPPLVITKIMNNPPVTNLSPGNDWFPGRNPANSKFFLSFREKS